jgi:cytochrome P450
MVKPIDQLPVVHMPENYPYVMPSCMAQAAMEYGPIFRIDWPPMKKVVCLVGPEANELFYHSHERNLSHEIGWAAILQILVGKGLVSMDVPEHTYYRKLINPLMTARHIASRFAMICDVIRHRISTWQDGDVVDLYSEIRTIAFTVIAKLLCSIEDAEEIGQLRDAFRRLVTPGRDPNTETRGP